MWSSTKITEQSKAVNSRALSELSLECGFSIEDWAGIGAKELLCGARLIPD
ncbi:hypothetical protein LPAF129_06620 [Ligilactobacillus pabuli]|uniref:Uncharacterized protein n=1 Tax=Ligilactobacillus pabuli TaxID=2886039 RepID=A0ABQ5JHJ0_9LACO|nr:hypothetical protein LPAF129_06620 [Ligilactobacillus pabuli]